MAKWNRIKYLPCMPIGEDGRRITGSEKHRALSRSVAAEGMILLKNENNVLPLKHGSKVALVGRGSADYVEFGGGSGSVTTAKKCSLCDGMEDKEKEGKVSLYMPLNQLYKNEIEKQYNSGAWPGKTVEPELSIEIIKAAALECDTAIFSISRRTGEGSDVELQDEKNAFYLWEKDKEILDIVTSNFQKVIVVLNIGTVMDVSWIVNNPKVQALLLIWQAGMEGGMATADILCGDVCPSGKLPDTFADIYDYPSTKSFMESSEYVEYVEDIFVGYRYFETIPNANKKVYYPFGFGLSYTTFEIVCDDVYLAEDKMIKILCKVTNSGKVSGKEVIQVYTSSPVGRLDKPAKELRAFKKTRLLNPGETQCIEIEFCIEDMISYSEETATYIMEPGEYLVYVGNSVRDVKCVYQYYLPEEKIIKQLSNKVIARKLSKRMRADGTFCELDVIDYESVADLEGWPEKTSWSIEHIIPDRRGVKIPDDRYTLEMVVEQKISIEQFIEQLNDDELITLLGGRPNVGTADTFGIGDLPDYGVPAMMTADGPAGLRIKPEIGVTTTSWPCATLLASTWNEEVLMQVGQAGALEVKENNFGMWLTPALNIHRNPLCGRNFEYYSEDPLLSGVMASAMIKGIQNECISACAKHFCCNNKEVDRMVSDSRVSERALREIYLKGFEIAVEKSQPWAIMTSYNKVNGKYSSENKELLTDILREEWGYQGLVCTDWGNYAEHHLEVLAGNDVKMPAGYSKRLQRAKTEGIISRCDLERSAKRVLSLLLHIE